MKYPALILVCLAMQAQAQICHELDVGARVGAFIPESNLFQKIYGTAPMYGIEAIYSPFRSVKWWTNVSYLYAEGHSVPLHNKTTLQMIPISTGLNYYYPLSPCFLAFIGAGGSYTIIRVRNYSEFLTPLTKRGIFGLVGKVGLQANYRRFYGTLFLDYIFQRLPMDNPGGEEESFSDVSGFYLGVSCGVRF